MDKEKTPAEDVSQLLANVAIVLMEPKYPENIGAAARCAMNFGISRLVVVLNKEPDRERILKMATHNATHLIDNMEVYGDLPQALSSFSCVVGTTARKGRKRFIENTPRVIGEKLLPFLKKNKVVGINHRGPSSL